MHQFMVRRHLAVPPGDATLGRGVVLVVFCQLQESLRAITLLMVRKACLERESN
jgi:hypothetical protein